MCLQQSEFAFVFASLSRPFPGLFTLIVLLFSLFGWVLVIRVIVIVYRSRKKGGAR